MVSKEAGGSRRWCESRQQTQLSGRETAPDTREAATSIIIETSPRQCSFSKYVDYSPPPATLPSLSCGLPGAGASCRSR